MPLSTILIWSALFCLGFGGFFATRKPISRYALSIGWVMLGVFWAVMTPHYLYTKDSLIEGVLCVIALPIGLYAGWLVYTRRPPALDLLGRAVSVMGLIYLPIEQIPVARRIAIESVTTQTVAAVEFLFGYELVIQEGPLYGYQSGIAAPHAPGGLLLTHIELACTGLGSIAIVVGLIAVLNEPASKRLLAAIGATAGIYLLNVVRTIFITSAYVGQWFQYYVPQILDFTGYEDGRVASFFIADKVIGQSLSVLVLIGIILGLRVAFPSFDSVVRDVLALAPERD